MIWNFCQSTGRTTRIEAKRAQGGLPHSLWETYSAFANTLGGVILLGVAEAKDGSLYSVPLLDPEELVEEFWSIVQDPKLVSANVLRTEDVRLMRSGRNTVVAIFVPRADFRQRPVYLGSDPYRGTYYRCGEGDRRSPRARGGGHAPRPGKRLSVGRIARSAGGSPASSLYPGG